MCPTLEFASSLSYITLFSDGPGVLLCPKWTRVVTEVRVNIWARNRVMIRVRVRLRP